MSDARDTNRDGKVSLMEKVKDKLHLGHKDKDAEYTATHHTTGHHVTPIIGASSRHTTPVIGTVPLVGAVPTALPVMPIGSAGSAMPMAGSSMPMAGSTGFADPRDLNRDGYVSTSEKLATAGPLHSSAMPLAGSSTMPLAAGAHMGAGFQHDEARLRLHEEQLAISKREVGAGEVDIHKRIQEEIVQQTIPVRREEVTVERRALHGVAEPGARIAAQDEVVRVPLFREEIITEKRIVPTEEVIVRKTEVLDQQTVAATLRSEYVETTQSNMATNISGAAFDARDLNRDGHVSMGEKLQGGSAFPTTSGAFDARDTNRDGHVSMAEKLKGGFSDGRDLNRDGHVSMGEKLKTAPDANRDGHVSMGEKFRAARG